MDKNNPDPNMENDNTEHIRGKRLSSILKAPRQPLDDLGSGNELTQDLNTEKRRKNSRRVSFADTIKVFPRDLKNNVSERENTGMNTLLHAPIQASVQQAEWHDEDTPTARPSRQDTTLVFSEGAEMEMTASHTAVISRNLRSSQADWTEKIDITSFLAALNPTSGQPAESKEFCFQSALSCPSPEQKEEGTAVKKIDFNEFLMSLKSQEKAPNAVEGPEKENVFLVPSQVLEDMALSSVEFVYPHQQLDTCNLTKVFRAPDDGMEMTKCQVPAAGQTMSAIPGSISAETVFQGDKTLVFSKCEDMEMTGNYTDVIWDESSKEVNSSHHRTCCQNSDKQEKAHTMRVVNKGLPTRVVSEREFSSGKMVQVDSNNPASADGPHSKGAGDPLLLSTSAAHRRSSHLPLFSEKSVFFPSGENMDLTGNCTQMGLDCNSSVGLSARAAGPAHLAQDENKTRALHRGDREPIPAMAAADKTMVFIPSQHDMEITASHTVPVSDKGFESQQ
ncbi:Protein CASC5, partial [Calypte anna]